MTEMAMTVLVYSLSVFVVAWLMPSVHLRGFNTAVGVAIVYGLLKFFFRWALVLVSLPLIIVTLGLFLFVINAFLLWITDKLIDGFRIESLRSTIVASILISVLDVIFKWVLLGI